MKTIEVTDEQYLFVQQLREEISERVVGKYGFVRERDAVQFMIDNLAEDVEIDGEFESSATTDVAASVAASIADESSEAADRDVETGPDEGDAITFDEESMDESEESADGSTPIDDEEGEAIDDENDTEDDEAEDADEAPIDDEADVDVDEGDDADGGGEADADDGGEADAEDDGGTGADEDGGDVGGSADDDEMLDRMMNLLETHDDKWEESPSADYRYRVTLPDGTTEDVQTKDDVRALLFKNY